MSQNTLPAENAQILEMFTELSPPRRAMAESYIRFLRHEQGDSYENDAMVAQMAEEILEKHHPAFAELAK